MTCLFVSTVIDCSLGSYQYWSHCNFCEFTLKYKFNFSNGNSLYVVLDPINRIYLRSSFLNAALAFLYVCSHGGPLHRHCEFTKPLCMVNNCYFLIKYLFQPFSILYCIFVASIQSFSVCVYSSWTGIMTGASNLISLRATSPVWLTSKGWLKL